jgi:hypothetical protein
MDCQDSFIFSEDSMASGFNSSHRSAIISMYRSTGLRTLTVLLAMLSAIVISGPARSQTAKTSTQTESYPSGATKSQDTTVTSADGTTKYSETHTEYDESGRPTHETQKTYRDGSVYQTHDKTWIYDDKGRLIYFESTDTVAGDKVIGGVEQKYRVHKKYKDENDKDGTNTSEETYSSVTGKWRAFDGEGGDTQPSMKASQPLKSDKKSAEKSKNDTSGAQRSTVGNTPTAINGGNAPGYQVGGNTANGLYVAEFTTPQGSIKVNVTDDLAAGDTFSGTVEEQPAGKNDAERAENESRLNGYVFQAEQQSTPVGEKTFTRQIPSTVSVAARTFRLVLNGKTVATTEVPISSVQPPRPVASTVPTGGEKGKLLEISEPCNGVFDSADYVKIGGTTVPEVAESPRKKVVRNTSQPLGQTEIVDSENGHVTRAPFRNMGIQLAAPVAHLQEHQTTTLTTTVRGLKDITHEVPLRLVNNSPAVISMSGGNEQNLMIHPAEVSADGTYSNHCTLTGIQPGAFGVTGTVTWNEVYTSPVTNLAAEIVAALPTTPVHNTTKGTTLTHPGTDSTTTVDHKTGQTHVKDTKTGTTVTVDPKKKTTTAKDDKTGKSTTIPHDKNGSAGGKNGEPKVDVKVDEKTNADGTITTTTVITITSNGQTSTVTGTSTTDGNGGHTTEVKDPVDPNSSTSTTVDKNGDVTKTGTTTKNPDGTKTETSTDAKTGVTTVKGSNGSYTLTPDPNGGQTRIDYNTADGTGGTIYVPPGSDITPNPGSLTNPLPFNYTPPPPPPPPKP